MYNGIIITLCLLGIIYIIVKRDFIIHSVKKIINRPELKALEAKNDTLMRGLDLCTKHESQLKAQVAMFEFEEELLHTGVWFWDMTTNPDQVMYSDNFAKIFDIAPGQIVDAKFLMDVVHTDDRERVNTLLKSAFENHVSYEVEYRVVRRNDRNDLVKCKGVPELNSNGKVLRIKGTIQLLKQDVD